ncbi:hypothetical protein BD769DRAFT_923269 [Suillus cothurnatus]|nr:hypothetical protein BD769DRAFT_923269 [Suillus cothurnatus]
MTETFLVFKVLVACVISSLIQSKASSFCLISHRNTSPNQESGDQISISIMLILAIEALNDGIGISSTNTKLLFTPPPHTRPSNMTVVSNDPSLWPIFNSDLLYSYAMVAAGVVVVYDWVLTLGQEIELIWKKRWSLMTVLYLIIRYIGLLYSVINVFTNMPLVLLTDAAVFCSTRKM